MMKHIAFLHTAAAHVETFQALTEQQASGTRIEHQVREDLLARARELGTHHPELSRQVADAMTRSAANGASVVVCTCSTLGALAEDLPLANGATAMRIDRAMADAAVAAGSRILVVAALQSTLQPTAELISDSARRARKAIALECLWLDGTWQHFESGDQHAYITSIAAAVRPTVAGFDVVVLAQASMARAAQLLADIGVPVLSSPLIGVRAALAASVVTAQGS